MSPEDAANWEKLVACAIEGGHGVEICDDALRLMRLARTSADHRRDYERVKRVFKDQLGDLDS